MLIIGSELERNIKWRSVDYTDYSEVLSSACFVVWHMKLCVAMYVGILKRNPMQELLIAMASAAGSL